MSFVDIGQEWDTPNVDLFKRIYQKSNNDIVNSWAILNCVITIAADSKIDLDYYCFYLIIIHAF